MAALLGVFAFAMSGHADATSPLFYIGISIMILGGALLLRAKRDQLRRGDVWTFGMSKAYPGMRKLYWTSYAVMVVGWILACISGLVH